MFWNLESFWWDLRLQGKDLETTTLQCVVIVLKESTVQLPLSYFSEAKEKKGHLGTET